MRALAAAHRRHQLRPRDAEQLVRPEVAAEHHEQEERRPLVAQVQQGAHHGIEANDGHRGPRQRWREPLEPADRQPRALGVERAVPPHAGVAELQGCHELLRRVVRVALEVEVLQ
eukprot:5445068-Lingulodinium_polyedra.AAC.2